MKYKLLNKSPYAYMLAFAILEIILCQPIGSMIILLPLIVALVISNMVFFALYHTDAMLDLIIKNILQIALYIYISYNVDRLLTGILLMISLVVKNYLNYSLAKRLMLQFMGRDETYNNLKYIYNARDIELIKVSKPTNEPVVFEHETDYLNYMLHHNNNQANLLCSAKNTMKDLFIQKYLNITINQPISEFWQKKFIVIISNEQQMVTTLLNELGVQSNIMIVTINPNIHAGQVPVEILNQNTKQIILSHSNIAVINVCKVPKTFTKEYLKLLRLITDLQAEIPFFIHIADHDLSLSSYTLNEARCLCFSKGVVYRPGLIHENISTYGEHEIEALSEYSITNIQTVCKMIACVLPQLIDNNNVQVINNHKLNASQIFKIYDNYKYHIKTCKVNTKLLHTTRLFDIVEIIYHKRSNISTVVRSLLNEESVANALLNTVSFSF